MSTFTNLSKTITTIVNGMAKHSASPSNISKHSSTATNLTKNTTSNLSTLVSIGQGYRYNRLDMTYNMTTYSGFTVYYNRIGTTPVLTNLSKS